MKWRVQLAAGSITVEANNARIGEGGTLILEDISSWSTRPMLVRAWASHSWYNVEEVDGE